MNTFSDWANGVLAGISAPYSFAAYEAEWAWSNAETAPYPLLRWNNPTNSTEPWPGAVDSGAQPGLHDVKIYASLQDGCDATVATLLNGFYGAIVTSLRMGLPRQQWGAAAQAQLHTWGTGSAWLTETFPAPPVFGASGGTLSDTPDTTLRAESPFPASWTLPVDPATRVVSNFVLFPNLVCIDFDIGPDGALWIIGSDKEGSGGFGLWHVAAGSQTAQCLQGDAVRVRVGPDSTAYVLTADGHLYHRTGGGGIEAQPPTDTSALATQVATATQTAQAAQSAATQAESVATAAQQAAQAAETAVAAIKVPTTGTIDGPITVKLG